MKTAHRSGKSPSGAATSMLARDLARHHARGVLASLSPRVLARASLLCFMGCAAVNPQASFDAGAGGNDARPRDAPGPIDVPDALSFDFSGAERPPPAPGKVYAHSDTTLWLLEPISKAVTMIGAFDCVGTTVSSMVDIASAGRLRG